MRSALARSVKVRSVGQRQVGDVADVVGDAVLGHDPGDPLVVDPLVGWGAVVEQVDRPEVSRPGVGRAGDEPGHPSR